VRVAINIGVEVSDENAAAVDEAAEEFIRKVRGLDGVEDVFGQLGNDQGRARGVHEVLDAKQQRAADKAEAKAAEKSK